MKKSSSNKAVSVLLSVAMCPMLVPTAAFAAEKGAASDQAAVQAEAQAEDTQAATEGATATTQAVEQSAEVAVQADATDQPTDNAADGTVEVNGQSYASLEDAFAAAEPVNGAITYTINGKVTVARTTTNSWSKLTMFNESKYLDCKTVNFVAGSGTPEICINDDVTVFGSDKIAGLNVSFKGLTLSRSKAAYKADAADGTTYFSVWASGGSVSYSNCSFPNGSHNNWYGATAYENCSFANDRSSGTDSKYGLWVSADAEHPVSTSISNSSFSGYRGIKAYYGTTNPTITPTVKVENTTFSDFTDSNSKYAAINVCEPFSFELNNVTAIDGCPGGLLKKAFEYVSGGLSEVVIPAGSGVSGKFDLQASDAPESKEYAISNGVFAASIPSDYCADGFEVKENPDGTYGVQEKQAVAAKIGSKEYSSINDAASSAQSGDTIVLYADVDQPGRISLTNGVTVDLNGHNVSVSNAEAFIVEGWEESDQPAIVLNNSQETGGVVNGLSALKVDYSDNILAFQKSGNVTLESNQKGSPAVSLHSGAYLPLSDENAALAGSGWIASDADGSKYLYGADGDVFPYAGALDADRTLELSGKYVGTSSIYYKGTIAGETVPLVLDLGGFTFQSTDTTKNGVVTDAGSRASTKLTIQNGKLYSTTKNGVAVAVDGANIVLKDVAVDVAGANHAGVVTNGSLPNVNIVIESGSVNSAKDAAVYFPSGGSLSIKDSAITGSTTGVQVCAGSLNISGKTSITVKAGSANPAMNSEGSIADGSPISLIQRTGYSSLKSVVIESTGAFKSNKKCPAVSAYSLNGTSKGAFDNADGIVSISAGTFYYAKPDDAFVKDGCGLSFYSSSSSYQVIDSSSSIATVSYGDNGLYCYRTFNDAVNNAPEQGSVVTLLGDTDLGTTTAVAKQGITIDLNGHTVSGRAANGVLQVKGAGIQVSVKNGSLLCSNQSKSARAVYIYQTANVSFENVCVQCTGDYAVVVGESNVSRDGNVSLEINGDKSLIKGGIAAVAVLHKADGPGAAKVTVNAGSLEGGNYAIAGNGNDGGTEVIVNGGSLKSTASDGAGIYQPQKGTLTLNGGQIEGSVGVQVCAGSLVIPEDSTVSVRATGSKNLEATGNDGVIPDGSAISIVNRSGYKGIDSVSISSGKFESVDQAAIAVNAYTYNADSKTQEVFDNTEKTVSVSGGTFSSGVDSSLCAEGFAPAKSTDSEGNVTYGVSDQVATISSLGGALRMDNHVSGEVSTSYEKAGMRIGYNFKLPEGAIIKTLNWDYGIDDRSIGSVSVNKDSAYPWKYDESTGSYETWIKFNNIKSSLYTRDIWAQFSVTYTDVLGKEVTVVDNDMDRQTRSVQKIATAVLADATAGEVARTFAQGIINEIGA